MALGNIKGGPFEDWVTNQIEQREISLGRGSGKNPKDLLYQQSKTPWLRLASSVNIDSTNSYGTLDRLLSIPGINRNEIEGINAARNFILQGGALSLNDDNSINLNSGLNTTPLNTDNAKNLSGAYGWGGTTERGLVPMPGITSAVVKYENDGALTKTTINIKCYSRTQFALIDALYMRPGYTILLEFGWSTYLQTTDGDKLLTEDEVKLETTDPFFTPALSLLLNPKSKSQRNQYRIIQKIKEERKRTSGNYEAVFGKIVNFKWSLDPDGSYNCVVELRGLGEVIESLKLNVNTKTIESTVKLSAREQAAKDLENKKKSKMIPLVALGQSGGTLIENLFAIYQNTRLDIGFKETTFEDLQGADAIKSYSMEDFPIVNNNGVCSRQKINFPNGILALTNTSTDDHVESPQIYVQFGLLLALVQKNIIPSNGRGAPITTFDVQFNNIDKDNNLMRRFPGQFPIAPQHYLIPYENHRINNLEIKYRVRVEDLLEFEDFQRSLSMGDPFNQLLKSRSSWKYNTFLGRLGSVYINVNRVASILLEQKGKINDIQKNEKDLYAFLRLLLDDININLGGINNIKMHIPNDGTVIKFVESIPQTFGGSPPINYKSKLCKFTTFGFTSNVVDNRKGSIVRNLGIDASIPSNFSSMIQIGAQPNGNQASGNATSFSNYNTGIIDRVIPTKSLVTTTEYDSPQTKQIKDFAYTVNQLIIGGWWAEWIGEGNDNSGGGLFADIFRDRHWKGDDIQAFGGLASSYHQLLNGLYSQDTSKGGMGFMEAPFFLPFNLSLDIDGMSGIVMMQRFEIDQKVLPPSYDKDSVEIIVKTVDHSISTDAWVTKLGTQSVPKIKKRKSIAKPSKQGSGGGPTSTGGSTSSVIKVNQANQFGDPVNALTRMRLTLLVRAEYGTLGVLEILERDEVTQKAIFAVMLAPQQNDPEDISNNGQKQGEPVLSLYKTGARFLVTNQKSPADGNCFWLYGNKENDYKFDHLVNNWINIQGLADYPMEKMNEYSNVLIKGGLKPTGGKNGAGIAVGDGFSLSNKFAQKSPDETILGAYSLDTQGNNDMIARVPELIKTQIGGDIDWYMDCIDDSLRIVPQRFLNTKTEKSALVQLNVKLQQFENGNKLTKYKAYPWKRDYDKIQETRRNTSTYTPVTGQKG